MQEKIIANDGEVSDTLLLHHNDVFSCIGRGFRITTDSLNPGTLEEIYEECHHCGYALKDPALFGSRKH